MNHTEHNARYLAAHPTTYGLGFAVFEEEGLRLIDWGAYRARGDKNETSLLFLRMLIKRYEPAVVLLEERGPRDRQRSKRIRHFVRNATIDIRTKGIRLRRIPRRKLKEHFKRENAQTKKAIAARIVEWFPELSQYLPPKRKAWMPEHPRMGMFEAIAIAVTYFSSPDRV